MPYEPEWLTLPEAIECLKTVGGPEPMEAIRRACADGNVRSRGLVEGKSQSLGLEWWHANALIDPQSGSVTKGPTSKQLPRRALRSTNDRYGPGDYQAVSVRGNVALDVRISREDIDRIWLPRTQKVAVAPAVAPNSPTATTSLPVDYHAWDLVDAFAVSQAACLWAEEAPQLSFAVQKIQNPNVTAYEQMIVAAIDTGQLPADHSKNPLASIHDYESSQVLRSDLRQLADQKGLRPKFLFPEYRGGKASAAATREAAAPAPRGRGRGRQRGSGSFESADVPLVDEMDRLRTEDPTLSVWAVASKVAEQAKGGGTLESKAKRLVGRYSAKLRDDGDENR